jgi:hypothetical protein
MTHAARFGQPVFHAEVFITKQGNEYSLTVDAIEKSQPFGEADPEIVKSVDQALREIVKGLNSR